MSKPGNSFLAVLVSVSLLASYLVVLPAEAAPTRPRKRPTVSGMPITAPGPVPKAVDKAQGMSLPSWRPKPPARAVRPSSKAVDLTKPAPGTNAHSPLSAQRVGKRDRRATKAQLKVERATKLPNGAPALVLTVASDQPDELTVIADTAALGVNADRAQLFTLTNCPTTPTDVSNCSTQPLPTATSSTTTLRSQMQVTRTPRTILMAAASAGPGGDFSATPFSQSSTWTAGGSSGDFTWNYPLRMPPVLSGMSPTLGFDYSSSTVDGRTTSTNNQPSWVGEGFDFLEGGITRTYVPCAKDMGAGANNTTKSGDLCWGPKQGLFLNFAGHAGELVQVGTSNNYRLRHDDGTRVERRTGAANGVHQGEWWMVTVSDGTQFTFGNGASTAWTVPVAANHAGEPGHAASFTDSFQQQAWAWKISEAVDTNGNKISYSWQTETNKYGKFNNTAGATTYTRGGHLTRIDYGLTAASSTASARVLFTVADRCLGTNCELKVGNEANWPDVPLDQICTSTTCPTQTSPTFFTTKRLTKITTQVNGPSGYQDVEYWSLTHQFPDPGDGTRAALWLARIDHTVKGDAKVLSTTFGGRAMPSRVDGAETGIGMVADPFNKYRVVTVNTDSATQINVVYSAPQCTPQSTASLAVDQNTARCFPAMYTPEGGFTKSYRHWFHRYSVNSINTSDLTGASGAPLITNFEYGPAAWRYNDQPGVLEEDRTWSIFAGYAWTRRIVGPNSEAPIISKEVYYRGLHHDKLLSGGTRSVSLTAGGTADTDDWWKAGNVREATSYNGEAVVSQTIATIGPLLTTATAGTGRVAGRPGTQAQRTLTPLASGGTRATEQVATYNSLGQRVQIDDKADTATTADDTCTKTQYASNSAATLTQFPSTEQTRTGNCAVWPASPGPEQIVSDTKTYYDNLPLGQVSKGQVTSTESATTAVNGTLTYQVMGKSGYDALGRLVTETDAANQTTTTSYGATAQQRPATTTVTSPDPDGAGPLTPHVGTTTAEPVWGLPVKTVGAGGETTEATYDAWARPTQVWSPLMPRNLYPNHPSTRYTYQWPALNVPSAIKTEAYHHHGHYVSSVEISDGHGRGRESQTQTTDTKVDTNGNVIHVPGRLVSSVTYDSRGLETTTANPILVSGAPALTLSGASEQAVQTLVRTSYDGAARPTISKLYSLNQFKWDLSVITYGGDRVTQTPPEGAMPITTVTDARGNTTERLLWKSRAMTNGHDKITYSFNAKNQLTSMTDMGNNTWRYGYDLLGRTTSVKDPNAEAATTTTYDARGLVATTTDPRGVTLAQTYDNLGRRTTLRNTSATGTVRSSWGYDSQKKGYLDTTSRAMGGTQVVTKASNFNGAGNPGTISTTIPTMANIVEAKLAGTYTNTYTYGADGLLKRATIPAVGPLPAETLTYGYDSVGRLVGLSGATSYLGDVIWSALGEERQTQQHNTTNQGTWFSTEYDPVTGQPTRRLLDRQMQPKADADVAYVYDQVGQLTSLKTTAPIAGTVDNQCFTRDHLGRLTQAWTTAAATCTTPTFAGPAPYRFTWGYDSSNNRTSQTRYTSASATAQTSWVFPAAGGTNPHRMSNVVETPVAGGGSVSAGYGYDKAGNTTSRWSGNVVNPTSGFTMSSLTWDLENKLGSLTSGGKTTSWFYDADGSALVRRDQATTTLYVAGAEVVLNRAANTTTATRHYQGLGRTVATRSGAANSSVSWVFADVNNTASWQVRSTDSAVTWRRWTPFGGSRAGTGSWVGKQGFVEGLVEAEAGLTRVGARDYEAHTGRFTSPDPILDPDSPLEWNPYAYGGWDPVSNPDPTGLKWCLEVCDAPHPKYSQGGLSKYMTGSMVMTPRSGRVSPRRPTQGWPTPTWTTRCAG